VYSSSVKFYIGFVASPIVVILVRKWRIVSTDNKTIVGISSFQKKIWLINEKQSKKKTWKNEFLHQIILRNKRKKYKPLFKKMQIFTLYLLFDDGNIPKFVFVRVFLTKSCGIILKSFKTPNVFVKTIMFFSILTRLKAQKITFFSIILKWDHRIIDLLFFLIHLEIFNRFVCFVIFPKNITQHLGNICLTQSQSGLMIAVIKDLSDNFFL